MLKHKEKPNWGHKDHLKMTVNDFQQKHIHVRKYMYIIYVLHNHVLIRKKWLRFQDIAHKTMYTKLRVIYAEIL